MKPGSGVIRSFISDPFVLLYYSLSHCFSSCLIPIGWFQAAEYDATHNVDASNTLIEILPTNKSNLTEAVKRQSAIIALERSFL